MERTEIKWEETIALILGILLVRWEAMIRKREAISVSSRIHLSEKQKGARIQEG